jgi:hypothetical protein
MNLLGDLRDTAPGEFAAYSGDEPAGSAPALPDWLAQWADSGPRSTGGRRIPDTGRLAAGGKYGRWLLQSAGR